MGGGERVGRAALQKTLTMVSALAEKEQEATAVSQAHNCAGDADVACEVSAWAHVLLVCSSPSLRGA